LCVLYATFYGIPIKAETKKLTAIMKVMATAAELDMTRALLGNRAMRDGIRDSASTSNFVPSRFDI